MLIAAAAIGVIVAYFFGLKPGMYAAVGALGLFSVAMIAPKLAPFCYLIAGVGLVGVFMIGQRRPHHKRNAKMLRRLKSVLGRIIK
jgi:hypothetical protein